MTAVLSAVTDGSVGARIDWDWEVRIPELETSVFILPAERVKNREELTRMHLGGWAVSSS